MASADAALKRWELENAVDDGWCSPHLLSAIREPSQISERSIRMMLKPTLRFGNRNRGRRSALFSLLLAG